MINIQLCIKTIDYKHILVLTAHRSDNVNVIGPFLFFWTFLLLTSHNAYNISLDLWSVEAFWRFILTPIRNKSIISVVL